MGDVLSMSACVITRRTICGFAALTPPPPFPSLATPVAFLYQFLRAACARACLRARTCARVYVSVCVCGRVSGIGRRRRVNLIVGFWVSASRRHRARYDDRGEGEGGGEGERRRGETRGIEGGRPGGLEEATGKGVPDKTTGVPTPVAGHPHEIRHRHSATTAWRNSSRSLARCDT